MTRTSDDRLRRRVSGIASALEASEENFSVIEELAEDFAADPATLSPDTIKSLFENAHETLSGFVAAEYVNQSDVASSVDKIRQELNARSVRRWQADHPEGSDGLPSERRVQKLCDLDTDPDSLSPIAITELKYLRWILVREAKSADDLNYLPYGVPTGRNFRIGCCRCDYYMESPLTLYPDAETGRVGLVVECPCCKLIGTIGTVEEWPVWFEIPAQPQEEAVPEGLQQ